MTNKDENKDIKKDDSLENTDNPVKQEKENTESEDTNKIIKSGKVGEELPTEEILENKQGTFEPEKTTEGKSEEIIKDEEKENVELPLEIEKTQGEKVEENIEPIAEVQESEMKVEETTQQEEKSEETILTEEKSEIETEEIKEITTTENLARQSNYQISLLDENHLRAKVITNKLVSIYCSVKDKYILEQNPGERHTNKIFVHPKEKPQEVEIVLSVGSSLTTEEKENAEKEISSGKRPGEESNYQISLIDENLLRVMIVTEKSVSIDCSVKDEDVHSDGSNETQANKIFIHPKEKQQEVEIIISIGSASLAGKTELISEPVEKKAVPFGQKKLTPNPLVANLIQKFSDKKEIESVALTPEEKLDEKLGPKNPWRLYKEMMDRNLMTGLVGAVIVYIIGVIVLYSAASKKTDNADVVEAPRLIVMQDIAENQFQQQNVEDPNKPKEEEKVTSDDGSSTNKIPPIIPKKINKPPRVIGPTKQKIDTSTAIDKELDSLRKANNNNITKNGTNGNDTTKKFVTGGNFPYPDSVLKNLKDNEVGLIGKFPPNWSQIDSRTMNTMDDFTGVWLVDTLPEKKAERLTMNVLLDKGNIYWKQFNFKNIFAEDSLKNTIYNIEPKQEGDQTYYRFYISGMAYNIYITSYINSEHFEKHKAEIEQVVRTIRIQKPQGK